MTGIPVGPVPTIPTIALPQINAPFNPTPNGNYGGIPPSLHQQYPQQTLPVQPVSHPQYITQNIRPMSMVTQQQQQYTQTITPQHVPNPQAQQTPRSNLNLQSCGSVYNTHSSNPLQLVQHQNMRICESYNPDPSFLNAIISKFPGLGHAHALTIDIKGWIKPTGPAKPLQQLLPVTKTPCKTLSKNKDAHLLHHMTKTNHSMVSQVCDQTPAAPPAPPTSDYQTIQSTGHTEDEFKKVLRRILCSGSASFLQLKERFIFLQRPTGLNIFKCLARNGIVNGSATKANYFQYNKRLKSKEGLFVPLDQEGTDARVFAIYTAVTRELENGIDTQSKETDSKETHSKETQIKSNQSGSDNNNNSNTKKRSRVNEEEQAQSTTSISTPSNKRRKLNKISGLLG
eukprot:34845_1